MKTFNTKAIVISVVAQQALGALWYSPLLFGAAWLSAQGKTPETYDASRPLPYVISILSSIVFAMVLSKALASEKVECAIQASFIGAALALGIAIPAMVGHGLFLQLPPSVIAIDAGSTFLNFTACAFVLGLARAKASVSNLGGAATASNSEVTG